MGMRRDFNGRTKADRAKELLDRLERGPASLTDKAGCSEYQYRLWVTTWIIPEVCRLIPQLKDAEHSTITGTPLRDLKKRLRD